LKMRGSVAYTRDRKDEEFGICAVLVDVVIRTGLNTSRLKKSE